MTEDSRLVVAIARFLIWAMTAPSRREDRRRQAAAAHIGV